MWAVSVLWATAGVHLSVRVPSDRGRVGDHCCSLASPSNTIRHNMINDNALICWMVCACVCVSLPLGHMSGICRLGKRFFLVSIESLRVINQSGQTGCLNSFFLDSSCSPTFINNDKKRKLDVLNVLMWARWLFSFLSYYVVCQYLTWKRVSLAAA